MTQLIAQEEINNNLEVLIISVFSQNDKYFVYSSDGDVCVCEGASQLLVFTQIILLCKNHGGSSVSGESNSGN